MTPKVRTSFAYALFPFSARGSSSVGSQPMAAAAAALPAAG
jgi:hypothetical protein